MGLWLLFPFAVTKWLYSPQIYLKWQAFRHFIRGNLKAPGGEGNLTVHALQVHVAVRSDCPNRLSAGKRTSPFEHKILTCEHYTRKYLSQIIIIPFFCDITSLPLRPYPGTRFFSGPFGQSKLPEGQPSWKIGTIRVLSVICYPREDQKRIIKSFDYKYAGKFINGDRRKSGRREGFDISYINPSPRPLFPTY